MCAVPIEAQKVLWMPCNWSLRQLLAIMQILEIKNKSFGGAASVLNC